MTKDEFYEEIEDFDDLVDFCERNDFYYVIEDFKSAADFDDWVWDTLEECRHNSYWYEIKGWLEDLVSPDTDWVRVTGFLQYENLYNEDLRYWIEKVIDAGDECDFWEEEDDDEEYDDDDSDCCWDEVVQEEPSFTSDIEITMLIGVA